MKTEKIFAQSALAVALSLIFPSANVCAEELEDLLNPNSKDFSVRAEYLNKVNPLYRQYYGINDSGALGAVEVDFVNRSDEGIWYRLNGYNLGLSTQEFSASVERQGDWAFGLGYDQIPRYSPFVINTPNQGVGTGVITLPNARSTAATAPNFVTTAPTSSNFSKYEILDSGVDKELKTERTATSLTASKFISDRFRANFSFKNEDKKGERMFGIGERVNPSGVAFMYFTPELINSTHQQFEASLEYYSKDIQGTAGYYGSFYDNEAGRSMSVITSGSGSNLVLPLNSASNTYVAGNTAFALAPSNYVNQIYVTTAYNYSEATRLNFKASQSKGVQNADFMTGVTNNSGRSNLGAEVVTTNIFGSMTSRLSKNVTLLASWVQEDRDDKTPVVTYVTGYTNNPESTFKGLGKVELAYRLPNGYKVTGGIDYDQRKYKGLYSDGLRENVNETTYRVDVKKSLGENINGKIQLSHSERSGSDWMSQSQASTASVPTGAYYAGSIQFSDRMRDKAKLFADWAPIEALNIQASYEISGDDYDNRSSINGAKNGRSELVSLDASYQLNDDWSASVWYSHSTNQISYVKASNNPPVDINWQGRADFEGDAFGVDLKGKVFKNKDIGLQYMHSKDTGKYPMNWGPGVSGAIGVPDTSYGLDRLRVYGKYPVAKNTLVRADYIYDIRRMDDYTWKNWIYSDGTTVFVEPKQTTQIFALTLIQSF